MSSHTPVIEQLWFKVRKVRRKFRGIGFALRETKVAK
jgi:hypothetical protein